MKLTNIGVIQVLHNSNFTEKLKKQCNIK